MTHSAKLDDQPAPKRLGQFEFIALMGMLFASVAFSIDVVARERERERENGRVTFCERRGFSITRLIDSFVGSRSLVVRSLFARCSLVVRSFRSLHRRRREKNSVAEPISRALLSRSPW